MNIKITDTVKRRIFVALLGAGVAAPSAYVAIDMTAPAEGFYTHLYKDPVGLNTTCIGHLVKKGEVVKKEYTEDECIALFVKDWVIHEQLLDSVVKVPYRSEWMRGAATDFTFHFGIGNVKSSTFLKDLNAKRYNAACEQLTRWVYGKVNGVAKVLPGLVFRATKRYDYCMGSEPAQYKATMSKWGIQEKE